MDCQFVLPTKLLFCNWPPSLMFFSLNQLPCQHYIVIDSYVDCYFAINHHVDSKVAANQTADYGVGPVNLPLGNYHTYPPPTNVTFLDSTSSSQDVTHVTDTNIKSLSIILIQVQIFQTLQNSSPIHTNLSLMIFSLLVCVHYTRLI